MRDKVNFTEYFNDFLLYAAMAKEVQNKCNLGGEPYVGSCGDDLIENVTIYDTVERKHAGFQNMIQDLWFADHARHQSGDVGPAGLRRSLSGSKPQQS